MQQRKKRKTNIEGLQDGKMRIGDSQIDQSNHSHGPHNRVGYSPTTFLPKDI